MNESLIRRLLDKKNEKPFKKEVKKSAQAKKKLPEKKKTSTKKENPTLDDKVKKTKPDNKEKLLEKHHNEVYAKQRADYQKFLNEYLRERKQSQNPTYSYDPEEEKIEQHMDAEVFTYKHRRDVMKRLVFNSLLTSETHNHVSQEERDLYENWKMMGKANLLESFHAYHLSVS